MIRLNRRPAALLALAAALALAGCTPVTPEVAPTVTPPSASAPTASSSAPPVAPSFVADGSAADNLPLFTQVVQTVWAGPDRAAGRAYVDALVAAGFDKAAMQVTADQTTIGNAAESIEFSVRWQDDCLVGQVGPSISDPVAAVLPGLTAGGCLIGQTRAIDW
ncbi:hypothetical protein [Microbacterium sp.]|uniref:DUF6993 domain-containing protein n=1 Tax=Microbacterium sp. TaxID=51671 RepID=UPI0025DE5DAA|nr:hypothetical protein [Microbacterium sp.]